MGSDSELQALLSRPLAAVAPEVAGAIESGPIDPRQALSADRPEGVIESGDEAAQTGWCLLAEGSAYTAVRTLMAGVSGRMLDWWFEWHALHPLRYRIWYPRAHFDISVELPEAPGAKPYWAQSITRSRTSGWAGRICVSPSATRSSSASRQLRSSVRRWRRSSAAWWATTASAPGIRASATARLSARRASSCAAASGSAPRLASTRAGGRRARSTACWQRHLRAER